jgi:hypothetical protein
MTSRGVQRVTAAAPNPSRSEPGRRRRPGHRNENIQRYLFDAALVFNVILTLDAIIAVDWHGSFGTGQGRFAPLGHPAVALHGVVSRLPSRDRWAYQPLFRRPDPKPILDYGYQDQPVLRQLRLGLADG